MTISNIFGDSLNTWLWLLACILITISYIIISMPSNYWKKKGVKMTRMLPVFGDAVFGLSLGKQPYPDMIKEIYEEAGKARYVGYYELVTPLLMIKSPELLKQLFVKDASKFADRRIVFPDHFDKVMSKSIVYLKGQDWKECRSFWSYVLTASKVEKLYTLLNESASFFAKNIIGKQDNIIEIELGETLQRHICKLSESLFFGVGSSSDEAFENFFHACTDGFTCEGPGTCNIKNSLTLTFPRLASQLFGISSIIKKEVQSYFLDAVKNALNDKKNKNHHYDVINLVMERQDEVNSEDSREYIRKHVHEQSKTEITAQLCSFLYSSLDGLLATLSYVLYELAVNQDVQKRLREEFEDNCLDGDHPSYDTIINLPYLDMVISETMRKWPSSVMVDRVCTEAYTIHPVSPDEQPVQLKVGDTIAAPIYGLHHDPEYFPNPTQFDPDRFSQENRSKIKPTTYLPWGIGAKMCNGGKLSMVIMKSTLFHLLKDFELVPTSKTAIPVILRSGDIKLAPEGGLVVGLKRRKV